MAGRDPPVLLFIYKEHFRASGPGPTAVFIFFFRAVKKMNQQKRLAGSESFLLRFQRLLV